MRADVTQGRGAQKGVRHRVQQHVRIAVTVEPLFKGDVHAAQNEGASLHQTMRVVALSHADRQHVLFSQNEARQGSVGGFGDFEVRGARRNERDLCSPALHGARFVGDARQIPRERFAKRPQAKELRRRRAPEPRAGNRFENASLFVGALHRVGRGLRENAAVKRFVGEHLVEKRPHFARTHAGARRVVHENPDVVVPARSHESVSHGLGPFRPARAQNADVRRKVLHHFVDVGVPRTHHHDDFVDPLHCGKRIDGRRQHGTARNREVLLRAVGAHAASDPRRTDERGNFGFHKGSLHKRCNEDILWESAKRWGAFR